MSLNIFEFFGFDPLDSSKAAKTVRDAKECPFVGGTCIKRFKAGSFPELVAETCDQRPGYSCSNRMYAGQYAVLLDVAKACFGEDVRLCHSSKDALRDGKDVQVFGKRWGKELRLPNRGKGGGYFVDWVLALVDGNRKLKEFVAVELQTMDTTGSYEAEVRSYYKGKPVTRPSKSGINWENVSKRILPQIIYKGHVLRREPLCTKGLFFICPTPVYQRIITRLGGSLADYHPQAGALTFRWYDLSPDGNSGIPRTLEYGGQRTTTIDQVALAFTSPAGLPEPRVYEQAICTELEK